MARHGDAPRRLEFAIGNFETALVGSVRASGYETGKLYRSFDWFLVAFAVVVWVVALVSPLV